jgi:hypothetical protein
LTMSQICWDCEDSVRLPCRFVYVLAYYYAHGLPVVSELPNFGRYLAAECIPRCFEFWVGFNYNHRSRFDMLESKD